MFTEQQAIDVYMMNQIASSIVFVVFTVILVIYLIGRRGGGKK